VRSLFIFQPWVFTALMAGIASWKSRTHKQDNRGRAGLLLWVSFGLVLAATIFDWMAVAAGHAGNQVALDRWRAAIFGLSLAALIFGLFGKGTGKPHIIACSIGLIVASGALALGLLLQD
jgi:hypothetical protein